MVPSFSFLRPITPDVFYKRAPFDTQWQEKVRQAADFHSPLNLQPKIPVDNILVVASRGDRICPFDMVLQLSERWMLTQCYFRAGGHWLVFDSTRGHAWYQFLTEKGFISG